MIKVIMGCNIFLDSILVICSGFIISEICLSDCIVSTNFTYNILNINMGWAIAPIILCGLAYIFTNWV